MDGRCCYFVDKQNLDSSYFSGKRIGSDKRGGASLFSFFPEIMHLIATVRPREASRQLPHQGCCCSLLQETANRLLLLLLPHAREAAGKPGSTISSQEDNLDFRCFHGKEAEFSLYVSSSALLPASLYMNKLQREGEGK